VTAVLDAVLPVFVILGAGYLCTRLGWISDVAISGVMAFTIRFAVPVLLFGAMARLDLSRAFDPAQLFAFYSGAIVVFAAAIALARGALGRRPGEAVAIGFCAFFSNTVLLGLPIVERAHGGAALEAAYAIVALHAPTIYLIGITVMEVSRRDGAPPLKTARRAAKAMLSNALTIGIALGLCLNLSGLTPPAFFASAVEMIARAALPAALFALGGVLTRYRMSADMPEAMVIAALGLLLHPVLTWLLATQVFDLPRPLTLAAVTLAAMPAGFNGYVFAAQYGRAESAAASGVLLATAISVVSVSAWLWVLGPAA
jgi:malonate transporter